MGFLARHQHVDETVNAGDRQTALNHDFSVLIELGLSHVFAIRTTIMGPFLALVLASSETVGLQK